MLSKALIHEARTSLLKFAEVMFAANGKEFGVSHHHVMMAYELERLILGHNNRLIINVPPRYSKTEMLMQFVAFGFGYAPDAEFISASYSKRLSSNNNFKIKSILEHPVYNAIFPNVSLQPDNKARDEWRTAQGGLCFATSCGGAVTGYGAGRNREGFGGALIIDDILKADEASSDIIREGANEWFLNTASSRLNSKHTPIVIIAQRLHENDICGFLLNGGNGETWKHVCVPALDETRGDGGVALWEEKHSVKDLERIRRASSYVFASQYQQRPAPIGGGIFKSAWFQQYDVPPVCDYRIITADTAQKVKESSDYSVFMCFGMKDNKAYLLDVLRGKWEAPELRRRFIAFWNKHHVPNTTVNHLRGAWVEDASSGSSLIQEIRHAESIPIFPITRVKDKLSRVFDATPFIESEYVYIPRNAVWLADFLAECEAFTPTMVHAHDDQIDALCDGIQLLLATKQGGSTALW